MALSYSSGCASLPRMSTSTFTSADGTELAYHLLGSGAPTICLPGGPMQDSAYLGDLGGLADGRQLVLVDFRGTGASGMPTDPSTFRCDRLVEDVEALRERLGLDRINVLGHSAGVNVAVRYAERYPRRIGRLALITPSTMAVGIETTPEMREAVVRLRAGEPWFEAAARGWANIKAGIATEEDWEVSTPFAHGRWDDTAKAVDAVSKVRRNDAAAEVFRSAGSFEPATTRAALAGVAGPVLVVAGELDWAACPAVAREVAALFPNSTFVVQSGAGHFPWLDDPERFVAVVAAFLG
jgi:pimeloyl-ACP methyl ester carboxylesterase